jgi:hypothetical protein
MVSILTSVTAEEKALKAKALERVRRSSGRRQQAERAWRDAIVAAYFTPGCAARTVGAAAGISHVRVLQIVDEETGR